jgi:ribonuclease E
VVTSCRGVFGDNQRMPFPAISAPASVAIGLSIGAIGFVVQESVLRRRAARRNGGQAPAAPAAEDSRAAAAPDVTATPRKPPARVRKAPTPKRAKAATVAPAAGMQQAAQEASTAAAAPEIPAPATPVGTAAVRAAPRRKAAPRATAPAPRRRAPADPIATLRKRHAALNRGLEAIVEFVDGPARRAGATACADALLLAVPKGERGPRLSAFLHAAGARETPARLQEIAEDAGVELAIALKGLAAEIRSKSS